MQNREGVYPAVIQSYDPKTRRCMITIDGLTEEGISAQIANPLGDNPKTTDIKIVKGDLAWIMFIKGDARYPLIIAYRNPDDGNSVGTRTFEQDNISLKANDLISIEAGVVKIKANIEIDGDIKSTGKLTNNGVNVGSDHKHSSGSLRDSRGGGVSNNTGNPN